MKTDHVRDMAEHETALRLDVRDALDQSERALEQTLTVVRALKARNLRRLDLSRAQSQPQKRAA